MRTPLVLLLGSLLVGCVVGDPGTGGDDDGDGGGGGGASCGDGVKEGSEICDDGNKVGGDGCSATCSAENPGLMATVDKTTMPTELGKTERITLTLQSVGGFAGTVQVAPSFIAGTTPITSLTAQGPTSINIAADATVPTQYTIVIPSNFTGADVSASLKFGLTSSLGAQDVSSSLAVAAVYTMTYASGTAGNIDMHPGAGKTFSVKRGAKIRYTNADTVKHVTHGGGPFPHENTTTGGVPNATYEVNTVGTAPGSTGTLGCHTHADPTYATFRVE